MKLVHIIGDQCLSIVGDKVDWPSDHPEPLHDKALIQTQILEWERKSSLIGETEE